MLNIKSNSTTPLSASNTGFAIITKKMLRIDYLHNDTV